MRAPSRFLALAAGAALLAVSACGGDADPGATAVPGDTNATSSEAKAGGEITVRGCTPENSLIGSNTTEVCGGNIIEAFSSKLIHYNVDTAEPEMDIAESIDTDDNQTFTVTIKQGYMFQDGTEVLAKNFVDAWNWAAYGPHGQQSAYFFEPIEGFADVQCPDAECATEPSVDVMSGLAVVDDHSFTIKTTEPVSNLPVRLGYTAFMPQSDAFLAAEDKDEFSKMPIGAGPFKVIENTATEVVMEKFADYSGENKPNIDKVTFRIYNDPNAAYNDVVANNLDLTDLIPADQLVGDAWKMSLDGRSDTRETGIIQTLSFSPKDEQLKDVNMRKAISMAVDREQITTQIFNGARTPATGWVSPVVDGYKADVCGDDCVFNPEEAKKMYDAAGGYDGIFQISINADGAHKLWADAVCNQLKNNLGMDCQLNATPDFKTLREQVGARELMGSFRTGWQMDYPSIENFLTPLFATGSSSNDTDYDSPEFMKLMAEGNAAPTADEANAKYQEAEAQVAKDFPVMPLWYQETPYGYSDKVDNVKMNPFSQWDLTSITVK
ncbi:MAG: ABC transporter substrate-binding protein [Propionibacteriaceae bacterium]|nr:ABC transporter substrate-binding protein [Propionibacteriaceae bacterium]